MKLTYKPVTFDIDWEQFNQITKDIHKNHNLTILPEIYNQPNLEFVSLFLRNATSQDFKSNDVTPTKSMYMFFGIKSLYVNQVLPKVTGMPPVIKRPQLPNKHPKRLETP